MAGNEPMSKVIYEKGSENVFSDLGFPDSEEELLRARLTYEIYRIIAKRGLNQREAAEILGVSQSYVSDLKRNRSGRFSVGKLFHQCPGYGCGSNLEKAFHSIKVLRRNQCYFKLISWLQ